jgi:glycerophosphoryl diester phosphodiesterase
MLIDVFSVIDGRVPVLVEIKTGSDPARIGPAVLRIIADYRGAVAVQSFDPRIVLWLKKNAPEVVRGQLASSFAKESLPTTRKFLLRNMLLNTITTPDFIAFDIEAIPSIAVKFWTRLLGAPLLLWTVKSSEQQQVASSLHANIIFEGFHPSLSHT